MLPEKVSAPIKAGDVIGTVRYTLDGETVAETPIKAASDVPRIDFITLLWRMLSVFVY